MSTGIENVYIDDDGFGAEPLTRFKRFLGACGNRRTSKIHYSYAVARFVDYLIGCGVFGLPAMPARISEAMSACTKSH